MSKKRAALRYTAASSATGLLALSSVVAWREWNRAEEQKDMNLVRTTIAASAVLATLTWVAALA